MGSIVVMIVLGLLVIFGFVVAYFSARTWSVGHVVLVTLIFLVSIAFVILASASLKTDQVWRSQYRQLQKDVKAELAKNELMLRGDPKRPETMAETIPALRGSLQREVLDRGRTWRGVRPAAVRPGEVDVNMQGFGDVKCLQVGSEQQGGDLQPEPDAQGQTPAAAHGITDNMVLYVFQEQSLADLGKGPEGEVRLRTLFPDSQLPQQDTEGVCRLPAYYLGQFRVKSVAGDTVTLVPMMPLDAEQGKRIQAADASRWTLYEIMPIDRHDVFASLDAEQLQALMPRSATGLDDSQYAALIEQYVRDNQPAREGDVAERTWIRVKFVQPYDKIQVDAEVDAAGQNAMADRDFDSSGLAVSPLLRQQNLDPEAGSKASFSVGDTALFDAATATKLIQQEVCQAEEGGAIYRRPLRDYDSLYHQMALRSLQLDDETALVRRQTKVVAAAAQEAKNQIQYRTVEKGKLQQDLGGWKREAAQLDQLWSTLQSQNQRQRKRLSQLYRSNGLLLAELTRLQNQLRDAGGGSR